MSAAPTASPGDQLLYMILGRNPGPKVTVNGVEYVTADLATDDDYWAAQPTIVSMHREQLYAGSLGSSDLAAELAGSGYLIDTPIMVFGWAAMFTMWQRLGAGFADVPDWTNTKRIPTKVLKSDYPPAVKPAPVQPPAPLQLVGDLLPAQSEAMGRKVYGMASIHGYSVANLAQGTEATAPDGTKVRAVKTMGLAGFSVMWVAD